MARELVNDEPWNQCFGCSPRNELGLRLRFTQNDDGSVESCLQVPDHLVGPPGTVHGGIQAVLLDEVMGMTARLSLDEAGDGDGVLAVTAELRLKYRKPVPVGPTLVVRGRLLRTETRNLFVAGQILGPGEEVLTEAEARFKALDRPRGVRASAQGATA